MSNTVEKYVLVLTLVGVFNIMIFIVLSKGVLVNPAFKKEGQSIFENVNFLSGKNVDTSGIGYTLNEKQLCVGKNISLLSLITSKISNVWQRGAIRKTWAAETEVDGRHIVSVFLLAQSEHLGDMQNVRAESNRHHDIILFDFQDDYLNLTLKTLLGFKWMEEYCNSAPYVLKTDDDIFMNYQSLVRDLHTRRREKLAFGQIFTNASAVRNKASKWFTSASDYKLTTYPPFLVGTGYVLSRDLVVNVLQIAPTLIFLNWEDVFVGMCLHKIGVTLTDDYRFYRGLTKFNTREQKCELQNVFKMHNVGYQRQKWLWRTLTTMRDNDLCPEVTSRTIALKI